MFYGKWYIKSNQNKIMKDEHKNINELFIEGFYN